MFNRKHDKLYETESYTADIHGKLYSKIQLKNGRGAIKLAK